MIKLTKDGDATTQIKYLEYLASQSRVKVNKEDGTVTCDGEEVGMRLPTMEHPDIHQLGMDIECEMRKAVLDEVTERFNLSDTERDMAQAELVINWRIKWSTSEKK